VRGGIQLAACESRYADPLSRRRAPVNVSYLQRGCYASPPTEATDPGGEPPLACRYLYWKNVALKQDPERIYQQPQVRFQETQSAGFLSTPSPPFIDIVRGEGCSGQVFTFLSLYSLTIIIVACVYWNPAYYGSSSVFALFG